MKLYKESPKVDNSEDMALFQKYKQSKQYDSEGKLVGCDIHLRNLLADRNSRLVTYTMNKFLESRKKRVQPGQDLYQDLYQEGQIGLLSAIDGFDPDLGFTFGTYATTWIKQAVQRHLGDTCPIAIPSHVKTTRNKLFRYLKEKGKVGTPESLVKEATEEDMSSSGLDFCKLALVRQAQAIGSGSFERAEDEERPEKSSSYLDFGFSEEDVGLLDRATVKDMEEIGIPGSNLRLVKASLRVRVSNFRYLQGAVDTETAVSRSLINEDTPAQDEILDATRLVEAAKAAFGRLSLRERCVLLERYGVDSSGLLTAEKE